MKVQVFIVSVLAVVASSTQQHDLECELPYTPIGDMCLFVDPLKFGTWYDMRLFCSLEIQGGSLVMIRNANQLRAIVEYIEELHLVQSNYWIAATDDENEGIWKYTDGSRVPVGAPYWKYDCDQAFTLRPNIDTGANCAALDKDSHFRFADVSCLEEASFSPICQAPTGDVPTTLPTETSTTALPVNATSESIIDTSDTTEIHSTFISA